MTNDQVQAELAVFNTSHALAKATELTNLGLLIESEMGTDNIFSLLRMGFDENIIAQDLNLEREQLYYILTRTKDLRREYMDAKAFIRAKHSGDKLDTLYSDEHTPDFFTANVKRFADHHQGIVEHVSRTLHEKEDGGMVPITVNNTVVVRDNQDIPALPPGVGAVIDMEKE